MNKEKKQNSNKSRRNFLKGLAAGAASSIAAGGILTGNASAKTTSAAGVSPLTKALWDKEVDVVVLGYGGSGIVAALAAAEVGAGVLILEKSPMSGGCTRISDCNINTTKSVDSMVAYLKATIAQNNVSDAVIRAISEETFTNPHWLESMGLKFSSMGNMSMAEFPTASKHADILNGRPFSADGGNMRMEGGHGSLMCDALAKQAESRGAKVLYNTPARELIQNLETGEIIGVRAVRDGKEIAVKAKKAVILCTGPFDFNDEMIRNYLRPYPMKFAGWVFNTGDGIPMASKVGARLWHTNAICGYYCAWFEEGKAGYLVMGPRNPSWMFCDKYGKRFADESKLMEHNFWKHMTEIDETGLGYSRNPGWIVFDETARKSGPLANSYSSWLPKGLGGAPRFSNDNSEEIAKGWIIKGETLKDLAEKTGMKADNLRTEIDHINESVAKGVPERFGRTTQGVLGPMGSWDNGPYYAMKVYAGGISTMGGPERNEKGQVIGWDGKPIPRLYEAGALGSIWGDHYGPFGGNVGVSVLAGGRIAGRNAAAEKPWL
jgi:succinate dehydrogenase/fumarate reductase flavoprotein subunit